MEHYKILEQEHFPSIDSKTLEELIQIGSYNKELLNSTNKWSEYLKHYLLLTHKPELVKHANLDELTLLINRYHWFKKFYHAYAKTNGPDAGIEQQINIIIENIANTYSDFKWDIIEEINRNIQKE